ncbi:hypothetical protein [Archangium sp.]|uniref:hypothetical protein n=1 Tax=Archangium sp. TaxID=1872627 RepID=UPI002D6C168E|nr:hypothetical protein [Archangium sp.]HYO58097.1 hypothetical protein [Archangium sp.]
MMSRRLAILFAAGNILGCATGGQPKFWRDPDGRIIVVGPMLGPVDNLETLAPLLCEKVRDLPGATAGHQRGGQEYCGAIYQRPGDTRFFASHPSSLGPPVDLSGGRKACFPPDAVSDPEAPEGKIHADYHSHPAVSRFSPEDLQAHRQRFYFRVMFNRICEVYLYDFQARTVFQLQDGKFAPIKQVTDDIRGE